MRRNCPWFVVSVLAFAAGCGSNAQLGEQQASEKTPKASMKSLSQTASPDGGVVATTLAVSEVSSLQSDPAPTISYTMTGTVTRTATGTVTDTGTKVVTVTNTGTGTKTVTGTLTKTDTQTSTATKTYSAITTLSGTFTGTKTGTLTSSGTRTATNAATGTASWVGTYLGTGTATGTKSFTATLTGTTTVSGTLSITATGTQSKTATKTASGTGVGSGSRTTTQTFTARPTATTTTTSTATGTSTTTLTRTGTVTTTGTGITTATEANACYGTWAFCDNFESGNTSKWTVQQGNQSDFTIASDPSHVYLEGSAAASTWHTAQGGALWMDQTIEAKMKAVGFSSSSAFMALFGRYEKTQLGDCAYYVALRGDGQVMLNKRLNGVGSALGAGVASGIVAGTWYSLKLDLQGSTIDVYLNGNKILSRTDSTCEVGSVGVASFGASFKADDVRVTAPTTNTCIQDWRSSPCAEYCDNQTQDDRIGCPRVLDCYAVNGCSPETCGGQDDVCGVNYPRLNTWGTASKTVADQVYKCMGCAGSVKCDVAKKNDWTTCSDGSACSWDDTCQNGVCKPGTPTTCYAQDQCHVAGTCDTTSGACSNPTKPDTTTCDDGNLGSSDDICTGGVCQGTQPCAQVAGAAAGVSHACSVRSDGSLWCWGANGSGQLGTGDTTGSAIAIRVGDSTWRWSTVTAGEEFTCAIRIDGSLWCWGKNDSGQLGNGSTTASSSPVQVAGSGWVAVQAGTRHACGVRSDGALLCWGDNTYGTVGDGTYDNRQSPTEVPQADWVSVSAGDHHTCGVKGDHTLWCWGQNTDGRLGTGATQDSPLPVQTTGDSWTSVSAGGLHTCAVKLDGGLWCWGAGASGQLGLGNTSTQVTPTQVGTATWTTVSAGLAYTCGVQSAGTLWCWGANEYSQLGDGTTAVRPSPVRVPGQAWANIATDATHTCGRHQDGTLWCWGANPNGELGDGTTGNVQKLPKQTVGTLCSQVPICGNGGDPEPGEDCDDGNNTNGDGCSFDCKSERCFGVVCNGSDQCHGVCNPATGECSDGAKPDGVSCSDDNACTQVDKCFNGACIGGNDTVCPGPQNPNCFGPGVCDPNDGSCSNPPIDKVGCNITLRADGWVVKDDGTLVAIFGHTSTSTKNFHPGSSVVSYVPEDPSNPHVPPPYSLTPGDHPGSFMPMLKAGQKVTWTVDGMPVTIDTTDATTKKTLTTIGTGKGVDLGGATVMVTPDLSTYSSVKQEPTQSAPESVGSAFKGALTGQLSVGPTGQTIYTVPIAVPPGIAGMAPNLNLVYNSQGPLGIAGQGWALSGLSSIHRCAKTKTQDGFSQPVSMVDASVSTSSGDGVCLDGMRMFSVSSDTQKPKFETESTDFSRIYQTTDDTFMVITKSGETRWYGWKESSHVYLPKQDATGQKTSSSAIAVWALDKVVDIWGNYFEIFYNDEIPTASDQSDIQARGLIVTSIKYTGHQTSAGTVDSDPFYTVSFGYEDRSDIRRARFSASTLPMPKRLKTIATERGGYVLKYENDATASNASDQFTLPSRLKEIDYCSTTGPAGEDWCLKPLVFDWDGGGLSWERAPAFDLPTEIVKPAGVQFVDLDGDGRLDVIRGRSETKGIWPGTLNMLEGWLNTGKYTKTCPVDSNAMVDCPGDAPGSAWEWTGASENGPMLASVWGKVQGSVLADFDGDGIVDIVTDRWKSNPLVPPLLFTGWCAAENPNCKPRVHFGPLTGLHNFKPTDGSSFQEAIDDAKAHPPFPLLYPFDWDKVDLTKDRIADINGDGRAEIVHIGKWDPGAPGGPAPPVQVYVVGYNGTSWYVDWRYFIWSPKSAYKLCDLNRDGLPDICGTTDVRVNTGKPGQAGDESTTVWKKTGFAGRQSPSFEFTGDVDGDGTYDLAVNNSKDDPVLSSTQDVSLATGSGFTTDDAGPYLSALTFHARPLWKAWPCDFSEEQFASGRFNLVDLNVDGLVDVVVNRNATSGIGGCPPAAYGGGRPLINTGTTWKDVYPPFSDYWQSHDDMWNPKKDGHFWVPQAVPSVDVASPQNAIDAGYESGDSALDMFVDLDGDGVPDRVELLPISDDNTESVRAAWLNKFRPPVIKGFPNGLATNTVAEYAVITTRKAVEGGASATYVETGRKLDTGDLATVRFMTPLRVVASLTYDNGVGSTNKTTYQYRDLRASASGRGPQGFAEMVVTEPSGQVTTTEYAQGYPFTGKPTRVGRENQGPVTSTRTIYAAKASPSGKGTFVYPHVVIDTSYLVGAKPDPTGTSTESIVTQTEFSYDTWGNPTNVKVTAISTASDESYSKETVNTYGTDGGRMQQLGRVLNTTVVSTQLSSETGGEVTPPRTHTTAFDYGSSPTYALKMKKVEPGAAAAGNPVEVWTAYHYDKFGNLDVTTSCDRDFEKCQPEPEAGHPTFRTTRVSFDPSVFNPAPGGMTGRVSRLDYGPSGTGRYPVMTTNAAGHVQYSAYDPLFGTLIQSTGPNGVQTCTVLDPLGWQIQSIERCGAEHELLTKIERFERAASSPKLVKVITRTTPPSGAYTLSSTDALGRVVETGSRNFSGTDAKVRTDYTQLGYLNHTYAPSFVNDNQHNFTSRSYDWLGRESSVYVAPGDLDGDGMGDGGTVSATIYDGVWVGTQRLRMDGSYVERRERKNVLGKVAVVKDEYGVQMKYSYDTDGNLTDTLDPSGNNVHIDYDVLGRKIGTKDPDLGQWTYVYNGFGDLVSQTDAKNQTITMTYDVLGRMLTKTDSSGTSQWVYDQASGAGIGKLAAVISAPDTNLKATCKIPYTTVTGGNRTGRSLSYTVFGQIAQVSECIEGETFTTSYEYNDIGQEKTVSYPSPAGSAFGVKYHYTSLGFLHSVNDEADDKVLWSVTETDASGHVTSEFTRNGVETVSDRNPVFGWLMSSTSTAHASADGTNDTTIQSWTNHYDIAGNLRQRLRSQPSNLGDSVETFDYDNLDRLLSSEVVIDSEHYKAKETFGYDTKGLGNLTLKGEKTLSYTGCTTGGGPHAVCSVNGGTAFSYDPNGNLTKGNDHTVTYTPTNKIKHIEGKLSAPGGASPTVDYAYGADGTRVLQSVGTTAGDETARTVYVGMGATGKSLYERTTSRGSIEHVHFIYAGSAHGGNAFALRVVTSDRETPETVSPPNFRYHHFDHLGSITASTDDLGHVVGASGGPASTVLGYDAWGKRRSPDGQPSSTSLSLQPGHREFTSHETIPQVGLVNMNGRVYDPDLGRFLSPDPNVQFVANLQSYNRYSYALNNPLRYTDPTGYFINSTFDTVVNMAIVVVGAVVCAGTAGGGCLVAFALASAVYNTSSAINGGMGWSNAVGVGLMSMAVNGVAGSAAGLVVGGAGASLAGQMVAGAVAGATSSAIMTVAFNQGNLGNNVLMGALSGAAGAALAYSAQAAAVSQASALEQQGEGFTPEEKRNLGRELKIAAARKAGQVSTATVGDIPIEVYGGTAEQRTLAIDATKDILTKTDLGKSMQDSLRVRTESSWFGLVKEVRPVDILLVDQGGSFATDLGSNHITLSLKQIGISYPSNPPGGITSYQQVIAHELGHAALGIPDGFYPAMECVSRVENPIMRQLHPLDFHERTSYGF